jgi:prevent-host-death family protein
VIVTTHQAKTNLSKLIQRALDGEEIIIARRNQPLVKLTVIEEAKPKVSSW